MKKALNSLDFLVVQEIFMSETAKFGNVVLPGTSFFEKSGTFTNGERRVQRVNEVIPPLAGTKTGSAAPSGRCCSRWPPARAEPSGARLPRAEPLPEGRCRRALANGPAFVRNFVELGTALEAGARRVILSAL